MLRYATATLLLPLNIHNKIREFSNIQRRIDALALAGDSSPRGHLYTGIRRAYAQRQARRQIRQYMRRTGR